MQQTVEISQPAYGPYGYGGYGYGCDPSWFGCWWPGFYPSSVIVVSPTNSRNNNRPMHPGNNVMQPRLPPPFGPPLAPFQPSTPQRFAVQPPVTAMGFKRG